MATIENNEATQVLPPAGPGYGRKTEDCPNYFTSGKEYIRTAPEEGEKEPPPSGVNKEDKFSMFRQD